jgi:acyl-coenzyme A thioesterase PaaI-like protein
MVASKLSVKEIEDLLRVEFPQAMRDGSGLKIEHVEYAVARVRKAFNPNSLRPGGTISGPTMMGLADFALYVAIFSAIGPQTLAVTTNLNGVFVRKPAQADLIADARLMKVGKRLVIGEVTLRSDGDVEPVAHVTATYSVPPRES